MKTITEADVLRIMETLPTERMNPTMGDGGCCYTSPLNPSQHCIAGEILMQLGVELPDPDHITNCIGVAALQRVLGFPVEDNALYVLQELQQIADRATEKHDSHAWGVAIEDIQTWQTERSR